MLKVLKVIFLFSIERVNYKRYIFFLYLSLSSFPLHFLLPSSPCMLYGCTHTERYEVNLGLTPSTLLFELGVLCLAWNLGQAGWSANLRGPVDLSSPFHRGITRCATTTS